MAIHGQCAQLRQVAPSPAVGASSNFIWHRLPHFVENAPIGCHDKPLMWQCFRSSDQLTGGTDRIRHLYNSLR